MNAVTTTQLYRISFDKIAATSMMLVRRSKPVFPVAQLDKIDPHTSPELLVRKANLVRFHAYVTNEGMRLPLNNRTVRIVLKELRFVSMPQVRFASELFDCGEEVLSHE